MSEGWEGADDPSLVARVEKSEHYQIESLENTIVTRKVLVVLSSAMVKAMRLSEIFVSVRAKHFREARGWPELGLRELVHLVLLNGYVSLVFPNTYICF